MQTQTPNVRTWSKTVPAYLFALEDLDVYVLKEHAEIVRALGRERSAEGGDRLGIAVFLLTVISPLAALFAWTGGRLPSGQTSDGLDDPEGFAAGCFALAALGLMLVAWRWLRTQRHWSHLDVAGVVTSGAFGVMILTGMANNEGVDVFGFDGVSIPVWLSVVLAAILGAAMAVASRGRRVAFGKHFLVAGDADFDEVRRLVGQLEPARQKKLTDERRRAIARLRARGLIDDRQAAEISSLPLGYSQFRRPGS